MGLIDKIFGTYSDRELKKIEPLVNKVMDLEDQTAKLSDDELKAKTEEFKDRYKNGESLDELLPEAFAVVREAAWRVLGMKPFRVQVIGGIILHQGRIAEMKTGEGKTLVATLPVYLNALTGKGVHVVTVNDYLAKRDHDWMGKVYEFLGLSVGCILHDLDGDQRREAYGADITYGTNNEFGFDYLRDNMVIYKEERVQRTLNFCIVDEVDSILIDEEFKGQNFKVVANLPYYITTPIIEKLLLNSENIEIINVMIQKEVAKRFTAQPQTKDYGSLSVFIQFFCKAFYEFTVPRTVFMPKPNVDSGVCKLEVKRDLPNIDREEFFKIVRAAFSKRRKTLVNSLSQSQLNLDKNKVTEILELSGIDTKRRAESLTLEDFLVLYVNVLKFGGFNG